MSQIFLCYAKEDEVQVREVYQRLQVEGFQLWMDKISLLPGQHWQQEIPKAIRSSEFILVFLSQNSVGRRGYIQYQFTIALETLKEIPEGTIHTIPVRLDNCEVPDRFSVLHFCNLFEDDGFEKLVQALRMGLSQRLYTQSLDTPKQTLDTTSGFQLDKPFVPEHQKSTVANCDDDNYLKEGIKYETAQNELPLEIAKEKVCEEMLSSQSDQASHDKTLTNQQFAQEGKYQKLTTPKTTLWRNPTIIAAIITALALVMAALIPIIFNARKQKFPETFKNDVGMEFMLIREGTFIMGSNKGDDDERPAHEVTIKKPFYILRIDTLIAKVI